MAHMWGIIFIVLYTLLCVFNFVTNIYLRKKQDVINIIVSTWCILSILNSILEHPLSKYTSKIPYFEVFDGILTIVMCILITIHIVKDIKANRKPKLKKYANRRS